MAGAMRKMAVYLGLVEDDHFDDEYLDEAETVHREPERTRTRRSDAAPRGESVRVSERVSERYDSTGGGDASARPVRNWRVDTVAHDPVASHPAGTRSRPRAAAKAASGDTKIRTLQPRSYNDARRIGEEFRSGSPVIMNLTELEDTDAKRIVDFAAGLVFGLRGSIERVTNKVFLLSPSDVDVAAEVRAQLAQDGLVKR